MKFNKKMQQKQNEIHRPYQHPEELGLSSHH
jgi:hypothetical protein